MLPDGFHFEHHIRGPGLYLGQHVVAFCSPANYDPVPPWRVEINPNSVHRRCVFTDTEGQAVRYMAAWARRWESRIMAEVASLNPPSAPIAPSEPRAPIAPTTHRKRRRPSLRL